MTLMQPIAEQVVDVSLNQKYCDEKSLLPLEAGRYMSYRPLLEDNEHQSGDKHFICLLRHQRRMRQLQVLVGMGFVLHSLMAFALLQQSGQHEALTKRRDEEAYHMPPGEIASLVVGLVGGLAIVFTIRYCFKCLGCWKR